MAVPVLYKTMKAPVAVTPEVIHERRAHYVDHCAICDANNGSGTLMLSEAMYPRPPNLSSEAQTMADGEIYYPIVYGIRLSGMPAFSGPRDDDARHLPKLTVAEQVEMKFLNPKTPEES